jgi:hypothetical protein
MNNWVSSFNHNPDLTHSFGPIFNSGRLMPFYHGATASWSTPLRANESLKFHVAAQNMYNGSKSIRVDWMGIYYYHRLNASVNSLYLGVEKALTNNDLASKLFSSVLVRGYASNYQLKYSIGIGKEYSEKWHNKVAVMDCGIDFGAYLYSNSRARVLVHYTHSLMQFNTVKTIDNTAQENSFTPKSFVPKTSFAGIQLQINLGKFTPKVYEEDELDPQPAVVSASSND